MSDYKYYKSDDVFERNCKFRSTERVTLNREDVQNINRRIIMLYNMFVLFWAP